MLEHHDRLNGSATAFIRAFSDLIKDSTSHLATKEDLGNMRTGTDSMRADMDSMRAGMDSMRADMVTKDDINTTNKNMQAQFARQEEKFAEINRNMRNMQTQFAEQKKQITEINQKLD